MRILTSHGFQWARAGWSVDHPGETLILYESIWITISREDRITGAGDAWHFSSVLERLKSELFKWPTFHRLFEGQPVDPISWRLAVDHRFKNRAIFQSTVAMPPRFSSMKLNYGTILCCWSRGDTCRETPSIEQCTIESDIDAVACNVCARMQIAAIFVLMNVMNPLPKFYRSVR